MSWGNRLRLVGGLIVVLLIVALFTMIFTQRQSQATSGSATIVAERYPVGTDYGGIVIEQFVEEGDDVREGDPILAVRSLQLQRDLAAGIVGGDEAAAAAAADPAAPDAGAADTAATATAPTAGPAPTPDGTMTLTATVDGRVEELLVGQGGFAQAGGVVASIARADSLTVEAEFHLSARDYGRIEDEASVELLLPDQRTLQGRVESVEVETVRGEAKSTIVVVSDELVEGEGNGLIAAGAPVVATLDLRNDGPLAGVADGFADFMRQIGF